MRIIKPAVLGLLSRPFEHRRQFHLGVAALSFLPIGGAPALLKETAMWKFLAAALPGQAPDAVIPKARGEFLAVAQAYAPGGRPVTQLRVGVMLGDRKKLLQLVGPRRWDGRQATPPAPFSTMPVDWKHSYGGESFAANPFGLGAAARNATPEQPVPLPMVLPFGKDERAYQTPESFGAIDQMWPQRAQFAGTYDSAWLKQDFPGFARDIDWRFFNIAPEDQQFDGFLNGDEAYAFENLHPERALIQDRLPGLKPRLFLCRAGEETFEEIPLALTTVWFFPGALRLVLVHHGRAALRTENAADVTHIVLGADAPGMSRPAAEFRTVMERRIDRKQGPMLALRDQDLVPESWLAEDAELATARQAVASEQLGLKRASRQRERQYAFARNQLVEKGLNPDEHGFPPLPPDEPPPTLEELPARVEKLRAEAEQHVKDAEAKAAQAEADMDAQLLVMGRTPEQVAEMRAARHARPKGPPGFSAAKMRQDLADTAAKKRAAGLDTSDIDAKLADPQTQAEWERAEREVAATFIQMAQHQDPADRLDGARSAPLRAALTAPGARSWHQVDVCGADLAGIDLSGRDLSGIWLDNADLTGANLAHAKLVGAVLAHARLEGCKLDGADLTGANLGGAVLKGASLTNAALGKAVLAKAELAGADFAGADLTDADLTDAVPGNAIFTGARAPGWKVLRTPLPGFIARGMFLQKAVFLEVDLTGANFSGAVLHRAAFLKCKLAAADFSGAVMTKCCFVNGCDASGADFRDARMAEANLRGSRLVGANFSGAELADADLSEADLTDALLQHTNATNARFTDAVLPRALMRQANFKKADLARADLRGADLRSAGAYEANLARARTDAATRTAGMQVTRMRYLPLFEET